MNRIFVSYSRADADFAHELRAALVEGGRDVWIDVDEIGPRDDWLSTIERAVEEATSVVFVASPDSLRSEICMHELRQAAARGKPIVAILRDGAENEPVRAELAGAESIRAGDRDDVCAVVLRLDSVL